MNRIIRSYWGILCIGAHLFGAASSSSSSEERILQVALNDKEHTFNKAALLQMPFFQALLAPEEIGKIYYNLDYDYNSVSDQENMRMVPIHRFLEKISALAKNRKPISLRFEDADGTRAFIVLYNIMHKMLNNELSDELIVEHMQNSGLSLELLQKTAQRFLSFNALIRVFNQHEIELLKQELPLSEQGIISNAFFAPAKNMLEVLLALIKAERKHIRIACYMLNNPAIIDELTKALWRKVRIDILVDAEGNSNSIGLRQAQLPFYEWHKARGFAPYPPKMHNKFFLFSENIFGQSILVTGSANCTTSAQENNEENIIVTNNNELITQFENRFMSLLASSRPVSSHNVPKLLNPESIKDLSISAPHATRLLNIISNMLNEKCSSKRSSRNENNEAKQQFKHFRSS